MKNAGLWKAIEGLSIGPEDASLSFSQRLARENGWSPVFAEEVIREYRRFIYLVALGDGELTPSDQVDQAWHLHMTYTRSYWTELCGTVLGRELHHFPTKGGDQEQGRFRIQYEKTLAIYEREFGHPPPAAIWPPVDARFRNTEHFVRINRATHWPVKKPERWLVRGGILLSIPLFLAACSEDLGDYDIWFWLKLAFGLFVLYKLFDWLDSGGRGGGGGWGCGGCSGCSGCGGD
jgi:hypothetical protein